MKKLLFVISVMFLATPAFADWALVDSLNLAPFVPLVLDALLSVATATYDFFVGRGNGIIYILVWGWLAITIGLFLVKMYMPKTVLDFFGFKSSVDMASGKVRPIEDIGYGLLKPALRAIIAVVLLLQIRPVFVTEFLIDPFLRFGSLYTSGITEVITQDMQFTGTPDIATCPGDLAKKGFISEDSCRFLIQPINDITFVNNQVVKKGLDFLSSGIRGLATLMPRGGENFLNIVTGIILMFAFVGNNFLWRCLL